MYKIIFFPFLATIVTVTSHNAMTASVTHHSTVSIASATTSAASTAVVALATMGRPMSPGNSSSSDTDACVVNASATALRRLYFKSARNAQKSKGPSVPKVSQTLYLILNKIKLYSA